MCCPLVSEECVHPATTLLQYSIIHEQADFPLTIVLSFVAGFVVQIMFFVSWYAEHKDYYGPLLCPKTELQAGGIFSDIA